LAVPNAMESGKQAFDVVVAGGGFAGRSLALALAAFAPDGFRVALVDAEPRDRTGEDARALALSAATKNFLSALGVWQSLAPNAQAMTSIEITDSPLHAALRPHLLGFEAELEQNGASAHLVEYGDLSRALAAAVASRPGIAVFAPSRATRTAKDRFRADVRLDGGESLEASLVVAADGKRSRLREEAGIKCVGWSYPQSGIVTTVAHERPHHGKAVQHFLPSGPFAILPLTGDRSSVVWTETKAEAERIMALDEAAFVEELGARFGHRLGAIGLAGPRQSFPLDMQIARSFVAERLALIGDAAHAVHPLAGQGLNIGMRDVAALAETIVDAARLGLDIGALPQLERYERWRRFDSAFSAAAMDGLNRLFSNDNAPLRALRDLGLGLVDRAPALKRFLAREAAGATGTVPRLLRGEAI
jgi:2-octaprenyl-6-methoxyphenol hydroxylase